MYYYGLKYDKVSAARRQRILEGLLRLRGQLEAELPAKTLEETFLLATWNIREFGAKRFGPRVLDSFYFIAEIISRFDVVSKG